MKVERLINLIPPDLFQELAVETKVDAQVKHLSGEVVFKLIMFSMLSSEKLSLRVMEGFLQSAKFKSFTHYDILSGKYNSIRDRICSINPDYFERLFQAIFSIYNKELKEEHALSKADSTYIGLATKLFTSGMRYGGESNRFVKFSVNLKGSIPSNVKVFTDQAYASEDLALGELIDASDAIAGDIVVFDRGLQSRSAFDKFTDKHKMFISRANPNIRCCRAVANELIAKPFGSSVTITSDQTGLLIAKKEIRTAHKYRIIKGFIDQNKNPILFVTNILDEDAYTIANWYKKRWEIEVFFKFIKQHLNAKHLVSRTPNGIKVMIYMTMITSILIIAYKKLNGIKWFKTAKQRFIEELDNEIIKAIVVLCGGDPDRASHLFNSA